MSKESIAKIESTFLGVEDHGIFTAMLYVNYGSSGQGIGQYALDSYNESTKQRHGTAYGMEWIRRVLQATGAESWEKVAGRTILVIHENDGWNSKVIGIKPLPTEKGKEFLFDSLKGYNE